MKCSVCGKEYGNGDKCKSCGADKVTALGNYNGYAIPQNSNNEISSESLAEEPNEMSITGDRLLVCYSCGEFIPSDSEYCPKCATKLFQRCPNCGRRISTQYPHCNYCGINIEAFIKEEERKRKEEEERKKKEEEDRKKKEEEAERIRKEKFARDYEIIRKTMRDNEIIEKAVKYRLKEWNSKRTLIVFTKEQLEKENPLAREIARRIEEEWKEKYKRKSKTLSERFGELGDPPIILTVIFSLLCFIWYIVMLYNSSTTGIYDYFISVVVSGLIGSMCSLFLHSISIGLAKLVEFLFIDSPDKKLKKEKKKYKKKNPNDIICKYMN